MLIARGRRPNGIASAVLVIAVAVAGTVLAWQGWRSRIILFDMILHTDAAAAMVADGTMPHRGALSSFGSYITPGTAWLIVPGLLAFDDPRLFELIGSSMLYLGTLVGVFLVGRMCFGSGAGALGAVLYGLSEYGLGTAGTLWSRYPLPFFYVWTVFLTLRWVEKNSPVCLGGAIALWAAGAYVFLEMGPAAFIFPVVWLIFRPRVQARWVLAAGLVGAAVFYPYLRFEVGRGFADVKSQVWHRSIVPQDYRENWGNPHLVMRYWGDPSGTPFKAQEAPTSRGLPARVMQAAYLRGVAIAGGLVGGARRITQVPGGGVVLGALALAGALWMAPFPVRRKFAMAFARPVASRTLSGLGVLMILGGIVLNEFVLARFADNPLGRLLTGVREFQAVLVLGGLAILLRGKLAAALRCDRRAEEPAPGAGPVPDSVLERRRAVLATALLVPWAGLLLISEPTRDDRFWWLLPVQVLVLSGLVVVLAGRWGLPPASRRLGAAILVGLVAINSVLLSKLEGWRTDGWSGRDSDELRCVSLIAESARRDGRQSVAIGYRIQFKPYRATFHAIDPAYKVGADLDRMLRYMHGLSNTAQAAEGFSGDDEYRVVELEPDCPAGPQAVAFDVPPDERFALVETFGRFQVQRRR